ncbi:hypothetical protein ScPMuIL_008325 [Solemya velum]
MALIQFCTYYVSLTLLLSLFKKCQSTAECQNFICKIQHKIDAVPKLSESTHRKECICCHIDLVKERNNLRGQLFDKICSSFCAEPSHWSAWAGWNCGSGIDKGQRNRTCIKLGVPEDMVGNLEHLETKTCNESRLKRENEDVRTSQLVLSPVLRTVVDDYISLTNISFVKKTMGSVEMSCRNSATDAVIEEFPMSSFSVLHNNGPLKFDQSRMSFTQGVLSLRDLKVSDSGTYLCQLEYEPGQMVTVELFSLAIPSNITIQETKQLELDCVSSILGHVFRSSKRAWYINGKLIKRISGVPAETSKKDVVPSVDRRIAGVWECVVKDEITKRNWKTVIYNVEVTPPPSYTDVVIERFQNNLIPNCIISVGIVMFIVVICVGIIYKVDSAEGKKNNEFESLKQQIEKMKLTNEVEDDPEEYAEISVEEITDGNSECSTESSFTSNIRSDYSDIIYQRTRGSKTY